MYKSENYSGEDLLNEDLLNENLIDEYPLDEDLEYEDFDESRNYRRRPYSYRPIKGVIPGKLGTAANFASRMQGRSNEYVTKSELKNSLDNISREVNDLKKSSISTNKLITALDQKHTELAKVDSRRNDNQNAVLRNIQMMSMFGAMLNQPKLNTEKLKIFTKDGKDTENLIKVDKEGENPIETDMLMAIMLPMFTTMGGSSGGGTDIMMPLMMMLMMDKDKTKKDNNMMLPLMLMTMNQNKK